MLRVDDVEVVEADSASPAMSSSVIDPGSAVQLDGVAHECPSAAGSPSATRNGSVPSATIRVVEPRLTELDGDLAHAVRRLVERRRDIRDQVALVRCDLRRASFRRRIEVQRAATSGGSSDPASVNSVGSPSARAWRS